MQAGYGLLQTTSDDRIAEVRISTHEERKPNRCNWKQQRHCLPEAA
jgi:hypothetical protein